MPKMHSLCFVWPHPSPYLSKHLPFEIYLNWHLSHVPSFTSVPPHTLSWSGCSAGQVGRQWRWTRASGEVDLRQHACLRWQGEGTAIRGCDWAREGRLHSALLPHARLPLHHPHDQRHQGQYVYYRLPTTGCAAPYSCIMLDQCFLLVSFGVSCHSCSVVSD